MMKDLKLSKASKKKQSDQCMPCSTSDQPKYPHGLSIRFESDTLKKFPMLENAKPGDMLEMTAKCRVKKVSLVDPETKDYYEEPVVELQITKAEFNENDELEDAFNEV